MSLSFCLIHFSSTNLQVFVNLEENLHVQIQYACMYVDNIKLDIIMQQNLHIWGKLRVFDLNYVCVESYTREKSQLVTYKSI